MISAEDGDVQILDDEAPIFVKNAADFVSDSMTTAATETSESPTESGSGIVATPLSHSNVDVDGIAGGCGSASSSSVHLKSGAVLDRKDADRRHHTNPAASLPTETRRSSRVGELMESTLSVSRWVTQRMTPNVEEKMSELGFTIHKLNLPEDPIGHNVPVPNEDRCFEMSSSCREREIMSSSWSSNGNHLSESSITNSPSDSASNGRHGKWLHPSVSPQPPSALPRAILYGRDKEVALLNQALEECCGASEASLDSKKVQVVMIAGESGVGKSALARQLQQSPSLKKEGGYFCIGKFDVMDQERGAPLAGIHAALAHFSNQVLAAAKGERERIRSQTREFFGLEKRQLSTGGSDETTMQLTKLHQPSVEIQILADLVPYLDEIMEFDLSDSPSSFNLVGSNQTRLQVMLHRFLQAICSPQHPLVLVFDDLQWADKSSLDLIDALVRENAIPGFLVVGCYRSNEVADDHPLIKTMNAMQENPKNIALTRVEVGKLGLLDIQRLLSAALRDHYSSQEQLVRLSSILLEKTAGNAYFLVFFLKRLYFSGALKYNLGKMQWQWDNDAISHGMDVTENVAEFIQSSLKSSASAVATCLLLVGACLGNEFEDSIVLVVAMKLVEMLYKEGFIWENSSEMEKLMSIFPSQDGETSKVHLIQVFQNGLEECVEGAFLSTNSPGETSSVAFSKTDRGTSYRFVHNKVQETALSLLGANDMAKVRHLIGFILIEYLPPNQLDKMLFAALDCLDSGNTELGRNGTDTQRLLELHIRAGEKSMLSSAYEAATHYFNEAFELLRRIEQEESVLWVENAQLRRSGLKLFNMASRAEFCCGNTEKCLLHINGVLENTLLPIQDKLQVYAVLSEVQTGREKYADEYKTIMHVLEQLGIKFPSKLALRLGGVEADLRKTKRVLGAMDIEQFISLPPMKDQQRATEMKLMDRMQNAAYLLGEKNVPLFSFRAVRWTVKYGIAPSSACCWACFAANLNCLGEFKLAAKMAEVAEAMSNLPMCNHTRARTLMNVYFYGFSWSRPLKTLLKPLLLGNETGLKEGDLENAFYCAYTYIMLANAAGSSLKALQRDIKAFQKQMSIYHQDHVFNMCLPQLQFVLSMIGGGQCSSSLTGEAMDYDSLIAHLVSANHVYMQDQVRCLQLFLAYYFDDFELAWKAACDSKNTEVTGRGQVTVWLRVHFVGLTAFAFARKASTRRGRTAGGHGFAYWKREGTKSIAKMKDWARKGNLNCFHLYRILEAEKISVSSKRKYDIMTAYEASIVASSRSGYVHDRALAYELAAEYLISVGETRNLSDYKERALLAYSQWGADAKVWHLKKKWSKSVAF